MRGTTNRNARGGSRDRAARRAWLVQQYGWPDVGIVNCYRCDVPLLQDPDPEAPGQTVTVDRIVPGYQGGRYVRGNIRPACAPCNTETGARIGGLRAHGVAA